MDNYDAHIFDSSEMSSSEFRSVKVTYFRGALLRDLLIALVCLGIVLVFCFVPGLPLAEFTVPLIIASVIFLFALTGVITELAVLAMMSKGDFTWFKGNIERYCIHTTRRLTYIYAVVEDSYCNIWANPLYSKGTEVYVLEVGSSLLKQTVIVKA